MSLALPKWNNTGPVPKQEVSLKVMPRVGCPDTSMQLRIGSL